MKRTLGLLVAAALMVTATACGKDSTAAGAQKKETFVLFVGTNSDSDKIVMGHLEKQFGVLVTLMDAKEVNADKARPYQLVVVSQSANPNQIANKFLYSPIPVVYDLGSPLPFVGLTADDKSAFGAVKAKSVQIKDDKSPLAAGLKGSIDVYKQDGQIGYGIPGPGAIVAATVAGDPQKATVFAYDKGATTALGKPAAAREAFYYLQSGEEINQTDNGWKLFDAVIQWTMQNK
jgi:hypothetical protein